MRPQQRNAKDYEEPPEARKRQEWILPVSLHGPVVIMRVPSQNPSGPQGLTQFCPLPFVPPTLALFLLEHARPASHLVTGHTFPSCPTPLQVPHMGWELTRKWKGQGGSSVALGIMMAPGERTRTVSQGNTPAQYSGMSPLP